jgi:hypothetical protein
MTADQLREFVRKQPFDPFTIYMSDGSRFRISHPESLIVPRGWNTNAIVAFPNDRFTFLYLKNVTHVSSRGSMPRVVSRRQRGGDAEE